MKEKRKRRTKDRILNTRIPEELDSQLRERANNLDLPISQLVRNILHCTVELVGNASGNVENLVKEMVEDAASFKHAAHDVMGVKEPDPVAVLVEPVIGWQQVRVNRPGRCVITGTSLEVGDVAHLGIRGDGEPPMVISDAALTTVLSKKVAESAWIEMCLNKEAECRDTGRQMQPGDVAYYRTTADGLEIISEEACLKRQAQTEPQTTSTPPKSTKTEPSAKPEDKS